MINAKSSRVQVETRGTCRTWSTLLKRWLQCNRQEWEYHHPVLLWFHTQYWASPSGVTVNSQQPFPLPLPLSLSLFPSLLLFPLKQSNCLQHSWESPTLSDADQAAASQSLFSTTTVNTLRGSRSHWNLLSTPVCGCHGVCASLDVMLSRLEQSSHICVVLFAITGTF